MNKADLVTGAAGGIGYATCCLLKEKGFTVIGMDLAEKEFDFDYIRGDLSKTEDGTSYFLMAAPLRIANADGAPVRAVLAELQRIDWDENTWR